MHIVVAVKQVPSPESLALGSTGRLEREGVPLEMSAYCRRALAKGVELARATGGRCTVVTLGPPSAEDVLREALAYGADDAVLVSDPVLAGSDTLVTAQALAALLEVEGRPDLVLVGRSSLDAETGQVGPQIAELLDLPFAGAVRELELDATGRRVRLRCEQDDGGCTLSVRLPAVLAVAERLCRPAKVPATEWAAIPAARIRTRRADELGSPAPAGASSPTVVEAMRPMPAHRSPHRCSGSLDEQVRTAVALLDERGALSEEPAPPPAQVASRACAPRSGGERLVAVLVEPDRRDVTREMLGAAATLAACLGGEVAAVVTRSEQPRELSSWGADRLVEVTGALVEEDFAHSVASWARERLPEVVLAPATSFGREVAARVAASLGAGLVGDALDLEVGGGRLRCTKPACGGSQLATIAVTSAVQLATVRPGMLPVLVARPSSADVPTERVAARPGGRIEIVARWRDDDLETLARASVVVGVGAGVAPEDYGEVEALAEVLGAELAATRKVTDQGHVARSRQLGITGRSISPRLYVALGVSGKLNHLIGVRGAGTILAVNSDPDAPILASCDVAVVGDWREAARLLRDELARREVPA